MPPGSVGAVVRHRGFAEQRFDDRRTEYCRNFFKLIRGVQGALAAENRDALAGV